MIVINILNPIYLIVVSPLITSGWTNKILMHYKEITTI